MIDVLIASNNAGKIKEMQTLLALYGWRGRGYQSVHAPVTFPKELTDYQANARQKVTFIQNLLQTDLPVLGDDSGLHLAAYPELFNETTQRDFAAKAALSHTAYLLELLKDRPLTQRQLTLYSYLVLGIGPTYYTGMGILKGRVALAELGTGGFDLDKVVIPDQAQRTLAQMSITERQQYQQRRLAIAQLITKVEGGYYGDQHSTTDG